MTTKERSNRQEELRKNYGREKQLNLVYRTNGIQFEINKDKQECYLISGTMTIPTTIKLNDLDYLRRVLEIAYAYLIGETDVFVLPD